MNFDLNINNYKINELRDMFDLPENYNKNMIDSKESKVIDNIIKNKNINEETKLKTISFLIKAKNILINHISDEKNEMSIMSKQTPLTHKGETTNETLTLTELESSDDHMVQIRSWEGTPDPTFYKGTINPLRKRTLTRTVTVDSRFRENYYNSSSTNFNVQLPLVLENVLSMSLSSIEMPTSYYVVSDHYQNNFFTITVNGVSKVIEISSGNYTTSSLTYFINTQLDYSGSPFKYINFAVNIGTGFGGSGQMLVGIDPGKPEDVIIESFELNFQADKKGNDDRRTPLTLKFGWIMGFRNGIYSGNLNYVSEAIVDISGPRYFYLSVDDFNNNNNNGLFYTAFNSSLLNKSILGRFPLNTSLYSMLLQNNLNVVVLRRDYFGPVTIRNLKIELLDEFGRTVDLNYMDFSFSLILTVAYDL
jgi:hypothetical protein